MSDKFFFKGRKEKKPKHSSYGFNTKRAVKAGTQESPLNLIVTSEARKSEIQLIVEENGLVAEIEVNSDAVENIIALEGILNKP